MHSLKGKTVFITGASRGVGAAIALRCAAEGANLALAAKTMTPHPKLPGTLPEVAARCEAAGGQALALRMDLRSEEDIRRAAEQAVERFGGIDVLVNNASVQTFTRTPDTTAKQFDLLFGVNVRGTFLITQACLPHLRRSSNPHILTIAAPLNLDPRWFADRLARTISKYDMAMLAMGWAEEFRSEGIASNALWPRYAVATMAAKVFSPQHYPHSRKPEILADAAHWIVTRGARDCTGRFFLDDDALRESGMSEAAIEAYWLTPGKKPQMSSFLDWDARAKGLAELDE